MLQVPVVKRDRMGRDPFWTGNVGYRFDFLVGGYDDDGSLLVVRWEAFGLPKPFQFVRSYVKDNSPYGR